MTDVSTYIEAEDYETKFYEKFYSWETRAKLENYTIIYMDNPSLSTSNNFTSTSCKNTKDCVEVAKS